MRNFSMYIAMGGLAVSVAACSSGTKKLAKVEIGDAEQALRVLSDGNGDAGDVISRGDTLTARQVSSASAQLNYSDGTTGLNDGDTQFAIRRNDTGELTMTVNGTEHAFAPADRDPSSDGTVYGYNVEDQANDRYYSMYNYTGEIDDIKTNGQGFAEVFGYQTNMIDGGAENTAGFAIVGTETRDADLATLPSATYQGRTRLNIRPTTGFVNNGESRTRLRSNFTMNADFADGTISGSMTELTTQGTGDREEVAGSVEMQSTSFDVNGFRGRLKGDNTLANAGVSVSNGIYQGAFYGNEADEVAGTMTASGEFEGNAYSGVGYFHGDKDD